MPYEPMSDEYFNGFLEHAYRANILGVDTETNGENIRDGRGYAIGLSIAYRLGGSPGDGPIESAYFPFRHESDNLGPDRLMKLKNLLEKVPRIVTHSKFDLPSLATFDIIPTGTYFDSLTMAHMINEEWPSKSLEWLSRKLLQDGKQDKDLVNKWAATWGWNSVPVNLMAPYACKDAELTLQLWEKFYPELVKQEMHELWPIESDFIRLLNDIERVGIRLDTARCEVLSAEAHSAMGDISRRLKFNPGSPLALGNYLLNELNLPVIKSSEKTGKPSFDKDVMAEYDLILAALDNPVAQDILSYRGWQRSNAACFEGYPALLSPDGRVRPNFKLHGTVTSRLSCEHPNLQQIPRSSPKPWNGEVAKTFIPQEGSRLWSFDYSQLELRLGTLYAKIPELMEAFLQGQDPHQTTADATGLTRYEAKTFNFAALYGAGPGKMGYLLSKPGAKVSVADGEAAYHSYHSGYPQIRTASKRAEARARAQGFVRMWTGRRRHFTTYRGYEYHKAFNSIIQGGGAEVVKRAMLACRDLQSSDCRMVLTVHDSIVFEITEGLETKLLPEIVATMERSPDSDFTIPLKVDVKQWAAQEEEKVTA